MYSQSRNRYLRFAILCGTAGDLSEDTHLNANHPMKTKLILATLAAAAALTMPASAQTDVTWTGATNTDFATGTNWTPGAPANNVNDNTAVFGTTITANQPNLGGNRSVYGLRFERTSGGWTLDGSATLSIGGTNLVGGIDDTANTSGTTIINPTIAMGGQNRRISTGAGGTLRLDGGITLAGARTLTVDSGTVVIASIDGITTNTNFQKQGAGTVHITGAAGSNFALTTGGYQVLNGTTIAGNKSALGGGTLTLGAGTLQASTDLTGANALVNNAIAYNGNTIFSGNHSITLTGNGVMNNNRQIANNIIDGKQLEIAGNIDLSNSLTLNRRLTMFGSGTTVISGNISNGTSPSGYFSAGELLATTGLVILSGTNTYTGNTQSLGGTLQFAKVSALYNGNTSQWNFTNSLGSDTGNLGARSGGVLAFNVGGTDEFTAANVTTLLDNSASGGAPSVSAGMYDGSFFGFDTSNAADGVFTIADDMALDTIGTNGGSVGIRKLGANTLKLTGSNSYTGATIVSAGTLLINGSTSAASTVSVEGSAGFGRDVVSALNIGADTTFANDSRIVLALDSGFTNASLNRTDGTWVFDSSQAFTFMDLGGAAEGTYTGLITGLTGSEAGLASIGDWSITNAGWAGTFSYNSGTNSVDLNLSVIPEPSTAALMAISLASLAFLRRRRRMG